MASDSFAQDLDLESLEVGALPIVAHFLERLQFGRLLREHLPSQPGKQPALATEVVLQLLVTNLLLDRQPLYAIPGWASRRVPQLLRLQPEQIEALNDDRLGRALDHFHKTDRASLLTALVRTTVTVFDIDLSQIHQDTTTATLTGEYRDQDPVSKTDRPPRITFGYNKDHRPDLKQLLLSISISDDGAVPVHYKIYDGNTADDQVHPDSWRFIRNILGHSNFLYVADSKLCSKENMNSIASAGGRFLTVMPRTRNESGWFLDWICENAVDWLEVHRQENPRSRAAPEIVYHALESPQRSAEGYRILWYRSSAKQELDRQSRQKKLQRARARIEKLRPVGRGGVFRSAETATAAGQKVLTEEGVGSWLILSVQEEEQTDYKQCGPGRPSENTNYKKASTKTYKLEVREDGPALAREALRDGLFPLMSNDKDLSVAEALAKYKYQPFVEKRHQQLKSIFGVVPMWLKSPRRVESLLWLYYVVELVQSLIERQVRLEMECQSVGSLPLYPEGRESPHPTSASVFSLLAGHRRHRLLDGAGQELRRFHDPLVPVAEQVLDLLGVDPTPYTN